MKTQNPQYVAALQRQLARQDELIKRQQRSILIKQIISERKQGLSITAVPDDLKDEIARRM